MAARRIVAGGIALWLALGVAQAQDVQNFEPAAGGWNYFSVEGGGTAPGASFVPSLVLNYGYQPLVRRVMELDNSWAKAAHGFVRAYKSALPSREEEAA